MALGVLESIRDGWNNDLRDAIDAGAGPGKLKFYTGTRPATGGTATTLLGIVLCSATSAPNSTGGVLTFNAFVDDDSADADGAATWARFTDSDDAFVTDCDVATSGADINLNSVDITTGGIIRVTSGTITAGNA